MTGSLYWLIPIPIYVGNIILYINSHQGVLNIAQRILQQRHFTKPVEWLILSPSIPNQPNLTKMLFTVRLLIIFGGSLSPWCCLIAFRTLTFKGRLKYMFGKTLSHLPSLPKIFHWWFLPRSDPRCSNLLVMLVWKVVILAAHVLVTTGTTQIINQFIQCQSSCVAVPQSLHPGVCKFNFLVGKIGEVPKKGFFKLWNRSLDMCVSEFICRKSIRILICIYICCYCCFLYDYHTIFTIIVIASILPITIS